MPEPKFKISTNSLAPVLTRFVGLINTLLTMFGLREQRAFWGIVYDSVTKQPLDPVLLTLAYVGETKTQASITDMDGNYGFLAHAGKFKILPKKTNYSFPSKLVRGNRDGIYGNLYHGEFFTLDEGREVVAPNIPMDPQNFDWNQQAKLKMTRRHAYGEQAVKILAAFLFWGVLAVLAASIWVVAFLPWRGLPTLSQYPALYLGAAIYLVFLILAIFTPRVRLWGEIKYDGLRPAVLETELARANLPGVVFGRAEVNPDGSFFLRALPGHYELTVKIKSNRDAAWEFLGKTHVWVGPERVVSQTIRIIDESPITK